MNKKMWLNRASKLVIAGVLLLAFAQSACASSVRGRLYQIRGRDRGPAIGFAVTVFRPDLGRSTPTYSDRNGMYYLQNLPPGTYNLEIWTSRDPRVAPIVYVIRVSEPYTDIPPIRL